MSIERELVEKTLLECTVGNSNKFYEIEIIKVTEKCEQALEFDDIYIVYHINTRWGKRTEGWQEKGGQKSTRQIFRNLDSAKSDVSDVIQSKLNKGYVTIKNRKDLESRNFDLERFSMLDL